MNCQKKDRLIICYHVDFLHSCIILWHTYSRKSPCIRFDCTKRPLGFQEMHIDIDFNDKLLRLTMKLAEVKHT